MENNSNQKKNSPEKSQQNKFIKYSGLGIQMIGSIIITGWIGSLIDKKTESESPIWTLVFMLLGVISSIYLLIRSVTNE